MIPCSLQFDFMISIVGPSTSLYEQQIQSLDYGLIEYDIPNEYRSEIVEYTNLVFEAEPTDANFNKMMQLLDSARQHDWIKLLDETDIPASVEIITIRSKLCARLINPISQFTVKRIGSYPSMKTSNDWSKYSLETGRICFELLSRTVTAIVQM